MRSRTRHAAGAALGAALVISAVTPLRGQSSSGAGDPDLTLPPDMRNGAPPSAAGPPPRGERRDDVAARRRRDAQHGAKAAPIRTGPPDARPVELGVTMRGGSGTPRIYAPTGTSQAIQESGSAFGAAMRFGF